MKYGIICAMDEEIALLREDIVSEKESVIANRTFSEGTLYGEDVVLVKSGIGKVASASTATTLINMYKPEYIIFCGTAGAISADLCVGDVVVADKLCQHDFFTGVDYLRIPGLNVSYFETDKKLTENLYLAIKKYIDEDMKKVIPQKYLDEFRIKDPKIKVGTIASGDQFICTTQMREDIINKTENCKCAEMEGAAVAQICYENNIPFAVCRVMSDSADEESNIDFMKFVEEAGAHFTRGILKAFLSK